MRIFAQPKKQESVDSQHRLGDLRHSDLIDDLFNNRESSNEQSPVKLRLSKSSRFLLANLKRNADQFLEENRSIAQELDKIKLDGELNTKSDYQNLRKVGSYIQWLKIRQATADQDQHLLDTHPSFVKIHQQGKDEQIEDLFADYEKGRVALNQQLAKNTPNYYYLVYRETYSFN